MQTIRFGIIGAGLMAREFASAAARWCHLIDPPARPEVVAVASRRPESLRWFTDSIPTLRQSTTDYREILARDDIDAVYCAVPHNLHERFYTDILEAGKHLFGEKPFGIGRPANDRIVAAARARPDLVVRCSSEFPYFPGAQRIAGLARENRFGRILEVECGFLHCSDLDPEKPVNWKRTVEANGEYGCMGDLGLHIWHLPLRFGWMPANVRAILSKVYADRPDGRGGRVAYGTWDNATLLCEVAQEGGSFPLVARTQRIAPGETNTWYLSIKGTHMCARFSTRQPRTLATLCYQRGQPQAWLEESLGYESIYKTITGGIFEFGFGDAMLQMIAAFCHQVQAETGNGGGTDVPFACASLDETRQTHAIFTAALQSHASRSVVEVQA